MGQNDCRDFLRNGTFFSTKMQKIQKFQGVRSLDFFKILCYHKRSKGSKNGCFLVFLDSFNFSQRKPLFGHFWMQN